jgi:transposase
VENLTIKEAGDKLGFKKSTAKMIVRKYKTEGKITKFK